MEKNLKVNEIKNWPLNRNLLGKRQNFSNQADFLLITRSSVEFIANQLSIPVENVIERFRPNLVIDFGPEWKPFQEEKIKRLTIGSLQFKV
jgi:uncharacterized protein YcbX